MKQSATDWLILWTPKRFGRALVERRLAVLTLGTIQALSKKQISLEQARDDLFNLDTLLMVKRRRLDRRLREAFEWAMELPNVQRLVPGALPASYKRITALATQVLRSAFGARQDSFHRVQAQPAPTGTRFGRSPIKSAT